MNLKNIYSIALAGLTAFGLVSCQDFLDTEPDERVTVQNEDQILQFLTGGYNGSNYGWICEITSDNIIDNTAPHLPADANAKQVKNYSVLNYYDRGDEEAFKFEPVKSNNSSDSPKAIWGGCYSTIGICNLALQYVDEQVAKTGWTEKLRAAYAEALLNRAYNHFLLVNIFSKAYKDPERSKLDVGIHYNRDVETKVHVHYERPSVAETYAEIGKDLEEGLKYVTDRYYKKPKWHFNTNAAHAFAARYYLYTHDYDKVIEHANAVLGTDSATTANMLMSFKDFDNCTYASDYNTRWTDPAKNNNLMLMVTGSAMWRRLVGRRFNCNGLSLRRIYFRNGPTWGWTILPMAMASGGTFWDGNQDHGFTWAKIGEQFEYTDKIAGIGYAHIIRREFTANELLLCRAEAYILGKHDKDAAFRDLAAYEKSCQDFSEETYNTYKAGGRGLLDLTQDMIEKNWYCYSENFNIRYLNCYDDWDFAANMGVIVAPDEVPYMNCINDFRRRETAFEGGRFFDVKRWGIEYSHFVGHDNEEYFLGWDDERRAIEIPQDALASGHASSRPGEEQVNRGIQYKKGGGNLLRRIDNE